MKYDNEVGSPGLVRESPVERFHLPIESLRNEELLSVLIGCPVEKAREIIEKNSLITLGNTHFEELSSNSSAPFKYTLWGLRVSEM